MESCQGCTQDRDDVVDGLCPLCRDQLGLLLEKLPVQRPDGPCLRCGGGEIIQALLRERGADAGPSVIPFLRPLAITHGVSDKRTIWSDRKYGVSPDIALFFGALVAYVCRACGHTELYCLVPDEIPIDPQHGTRLLRYERPPYR